MRFDDNNLIKDERHLLLVYEIVCQRPKITLCVPWRHYVSLSQRRPPPVPQPTRQQKVPLVSRSQSHRIDVKGRRLTCQITVVRTPLRESWESLSACPCLCGIFYFVLSPKTPTFKCGHMVPSADFRVASLIATTTAIGQQHYNNEHNNGNTDY
jgi:hypothetical protein